MVDMRPSVRSKNDISHLKDLDASELGEELLKLKEDAIKGFHYSEILNALLSHYSVDFIKKLQSAHCLNLFDNFFIDGPEIDSFIVLVNNISTGSMFKRMKCSSLLEKFTDQKKLDNLLKTIIDLESDVQNTVINLIGSIPSRMANLQKKELSDNFMAPNFIPKVCKSIQIRLNEGAEQIKNNTNFQIRGIARLLGKLCSIGYGDYVWMTLLPNFARNENDGIWSRISFKLLSSLQLSQQESFVISLLKNTKVERLFSNFVVNVAIENKYIRNLFTVKLLLYRTDLSTTSLNVLISHFTSCSTRLCIFKEAVQNLLRVWSDSSSLRHSTIHHRFYITKALILCVIKHPEKDYFDCQSVLKGVEAHLAIEDYKLRTMGMCCGEILTKKLKISGDDLEFEYTDNEYTEELKTLEERIQRNEEETVEIFENMKIQEDIDKLEHEKQDLDSDDDELPAYDQSNDIPNKPSQVPRYLRDCLDGIIQTEDVERTNLCLKYAVDLIRRNRSTVEEVGEEMAKVLLHISPATEEGEIQVFDSLIALIVEAPSTVTKYITSQVYEYNYTIEKRLLMLHSLAAAAKTLAFPQPKKAIEELPKTEIKKANEKNWKAILDKRLEEKTRRWGTKVKIPDIRENKLSSTVSLFFYPLLSGLDVQRPYLDLLGKDHIVLTRVIYTISSILNAAKHVVTSDKMCVDLLETIWLLRWHEEPSVKQALLYGLCVIASSLNAVNLLTIANATDIMEWLKTVMNEDPDKDCKERASTAFYLFAKSFNQDI